jgi:hypothetical protein
MPAGYTKGLAQHVDADGTVAGFVSNGPLDEGGRPAIWRYVAAR